MHGVDLDKITWRSSLTGGFGQHSLFASETDDMEAANVDCPRCNTSNPSHAKFCRQCGASVGEPAALNEGTGAAASGGRITATTIFTWIGYGVVGLFVLALLGNL